jgi:hypothetical protein
VLGGRGADLDPGEVGDRRGEVDGGGGGEGAGSGRLPSRSLRWPFGHKMGRSPQWYYSPENRAMLQLKLTGTL